MKVITLWYDHPSSGTTAVTTCIEAATGLDYFGARYFSGAQGRFTSPDPQYFQREMLSDPQRFNLYAYGRNNPLKFIDPSGEAIELPGDEEHRKALLEAIKAGAGQKAATYLYENKVTDQSGTDRYFVGVLENGPSGKGVAFADLNPVTADLNTMIQDKQIVAAQFVGAGDSVGFLKGNSLYKMGGWMGATSPLYASPSDQSSRSGARQPFCNVSR